MLFKYNFFLCLLQDLQRIQEDVSESLKIAVSDFSKIEKDNVMFFFQYYTPTVNTYIATSWVNNSTMADTQGNRQTSLKMISV